MNRSDGVGVFEVVSRPPSLGYVRRSPTEMKNEFTFVRRFDSPRYIVVYLGLLVIALGAVLVAASMQKPEVLILSLFFGGVAALGFLGVRRGDCAGVTITTDFIHWWCTGLTPRSTKLNLADVVSIEFRDNLDSNRIFIETRDQQLIECEDTFFGDGHAVLDAVGKFCPEAALIHNGLPRQRGTSGCT
ncbi:hypothetical protein LOC67_16885 [Stieleria sp. JC731]|uniref:hypothetical protein n=1 Tax=Stieleria sp. JC731 TaxID=2894195 RepID=UPI001E550F79|nr:hypothetical protein [Stieleria sp. JC731]MCC9602233.1 hypothetical protein [Stieleria sp. JC731]